MGRAGSFISARARRVEVALGCEVSEDGYRCCFIISSALISCTRVISQAEKVPEQCVCKGQTAQTKLKPHRGLLSRTQMSDSIDQSTTDDRRLSTCSRCRTFHFVAFSRNTNVLPLLSEKRKQQCVAPVLTLLPGPTTVRILMAVSPS